MDSSEKRRLKKLGKQQVEDRSRQLQERTLEANPADTTNPEWGDNYRNGTLKEKELRREQPDIIYSLEAKRDFVLSPIEPLCFGVPTHYIRCLHCDDLLHSCSAVPVACTCGQLSLSMNNGTLSVTADSEASRQWVKLMGKGTAQLGFMYRRQTSPIRWWQIWRWRTKG